MGSFSIDVSLKEFEPKRRISSTNKICEVDILLPICTPKKINKIKVNLIKPKVQAANTSD
jgi:hypothetical protein